MTQTQIDEIRAATHYLYRELPQQQERQKEAARANLNKLLKQCNHRNPDGSSANEGGMFCITCKICSQSDM